MAHHFPVNDATQIKVPLRKFLGNNTMKEKLTMYLANKTLAHFDNSEEGPVVSMRNGAESKHCDVSDLSSNHEEADTLLILNALHASRTGHTTYYVT